MSNDWKSRVKKAAGKSKVKAHDVSSRHPDDAPWDTSEAEKFVEPFDLEDEDSARYEKKLRRLAKRVANKGQVYNSAATQEVVLRLTLASILRQLPVAETAYKSSQGASQNLAYAYTNMITQAGTLMNDLRNMANTDQLADRVIAEAVLPAFMRLVEFVINEVSEMKGDLAQTSDAERMRRTMTGKLDNFLRNVGSFGQETLEEARATTRQNLKS